MKYLLSLLIILSIITNPTKAYSDEIVLAGTGAYIVNDLPGIVGFEELSFFSQFVIDVKVFSTTEAVFSVILGLEQSTQSDQECQGVQGCFHLGCFCYRYL